MAAVLALVLALAGLAASAQPPRNQVLDTVRIDVHEGCATIAIAFQLPVRIVRHFPFARGAELFIRLEPLSTGGIEREALFGQEAAVLPPGHGTPLQAIVYEGDAQGGALLRLSFDRPVDFAVEQAGDLRSVQVAVRDPAARTCRASVSPGQGG